MDSVVVDVEATGANAAAVAVAGIRLSPHHHPLADRKTGEGVGHEAKKRKELMAPAHTRRDLYSALLLLATNKTFTNSGKKSHRHLQDTSTPYPLSCFSTAHIFALLGFSSTFFRPYFFFVMIASSTSQEWVDINHPIKKNTHTQTDPCAQ